MAARGFAAKKLREGDTFTDLNPPELAGKTVFEVGMVAGRVGLQLTDGTTLFLDPKFLVEVER
jgi:hypothetical protein